MRCARVVGASRAESTKRGVGVLAGIDTHKDTLAVAVIDDAGRPVTVPELANTEAGFDALEQLLTRHTVRRVGIEGSGNYGRGAAVRLVLAGGIDVVEVPPRPDLAGALRPAGGGQDRPGRCGRHCPDHRPRARAAS